MEEVQSQQLLSWSRTCEDHKERIKDQGRIGKRAWVANALKGEAVHRRQGCLFNSEQRGSRQGKANAAAEQDLLTTATAQKQLTQFPS